MVVWPSLWRLTWRTSPPGSAVSLARSARRIVTVALACTDAPLPGAEGTAGFTAATTAAMARERTPNIGNGKRAIHHGRNAAADAVPERDNAGAMRNRLAALETLC